MAAVKAHRLEDFLAYVKDACPWFPEEGTLDSEVWEKVGTQLRERHAFDGPGKSPGDVLLLWELVRNSLDPNPEASYPLETQPQPIVERLSNAVQARSQEKHILVREQRRHNAKSEESFEEEEDAVPEKEGSALAAWTAYCSQRGRPAPRDPSPSSPPPCARQQQSASWQLVKYVSGSKSRVLESSVLRGLRQAVERGEDIGEYQRFSFPLIERPDPK